MLRTYRGMLRLYPSHVRAVYGAEMEADFGTRLRMRRSGLARALLVGRELLTILPDAAAERVALLSSHPSFHGRRPPDPGVVRPPNAGKAEWFGRDGR
jgi:hypothetical protein